MRTRKPTETIRHASWEIKAFEAEPATQIHHSKRLGTFGPASGKRSLLNDPKAIAEAFASMEQARERQRERMDQRRYLKSKGKAFKPLHLKLPASDE